ncbi:hypothetical protein RchiOBHm_Chr4g0409841 [Rosa chinensis]|uniref:Uncharacterized protein n=1 Tax=Rosa chinensis TaxID=74649 RepID=A0A2P6QV78_ROSCH|nr:hypothetical protein RchiOBHm_Chr4g0409841 [Rosa chinensis]
MNCGRCSNEKKRTVTVAERRFHRFPAIPATSGPHFAIEGRCTELLLDEGTRMHGRLNSTVSGHLFLN